MTLKSAIKKAINEHSTKYRATKILGIEEQENLAGEVTIWIEVSVTKKKSPKKWNNTLKK